MPRPPSPFRSAMSGLNNTWISSPRTSSSIEFVDADIAKSRVVQQTDDIDVDNLIQASSSKPTAGDDDDSQN
jgi:hypothetical protein